MSVKIRLSRRGMKKKPFYDIIVNDSRKRRDADFIEKLGYFDPSITQDTKDIMRIKCDIERAKYWLGVGAIPSERVAKILVSQGLEAASKFIKPFVEGEFHGKSRKDIKKILSERADAEKKRLAELAKKKKESGG